MCVSDSNVFLLLQSQCDYHSEMIRTPELFVPFWSKANLEIRVNAFCPADEFCEQALQTNSSNKKSQIKSVRLLFERREFLPGWRFVEGVGDPGCHSNTLRVTIRSPKSSWICLCAPGREYPVENMSFSAKKNSGHTGLNPLNSADSRDSY